VLAHSAIRWGDLPTWVGAIGAILAFGIALVIYGQSIRDRRKEQARLVSGWVPAAPRSYHRE
jgi:hypothetical protein